MSERETHVELRGIMKRYGGVQALLDVDLEIIRGSVHALVGENGAGKSTLAKIIAGFESPDAGAIVVAGRPVRYRSPRDALGDGITMIAQELALVPRRSVIENVFLGIESRRAGVIDNRAIRRRYKDLVDRVGLGVPGNAAVGSLRTADQQKVEILRALARNARLIVMDEPTAALGREETERLLAIIRGLASTGTTIVFVSHFLDEVLTVADTVSILKDGRHMRTSPAGKETPASLVMSMLGRPLDVAFPEKRYPPRDAPTVLAVRGLRRTGVFEAIEFEVREGEIVGLAGLVGSGRSEVARSIFGADPYDTGVVELDGRPLRIRSPRDAIRAGLAMLPESRKTQGLHLNRTILQNVTLPHLGSVSRGGVLEILAEQRRVAAMIDQMDVRPPDPGIKVGRLSGGNQQKTLFAKWLFRRPRVLIADEPTRGVDVGAKLAIYNLLAGLAAEGMAILLISEEQEEILGLTHRVLVMRTGRITAEFDGRTVTESALINAAFATPNDSREKWKS